MSGLIRLIFIAVIGYYIVKLLKPLFVKPVENSHVKGKTGADEDIQRKHSDKIEDADFEDIE